MNGYEIFYETKKYNEYAELWIEHDGDFYRIHEDDFKIIYDADSGEDRLVISI